MDISGVSAALGNLNSVSENQIGSVTGRVSMKMLENAIDMNQTAMDGITKMMEMSVNPGLGSGFDARI